MCLSHYVPLPLIVGRIAPVFQISNVTGSGLDYVWILFFNSRFLADKTQMRTFLNLLPSSEDDSEKFDSSLPLEVCTPDASVFQAKLMTRVVLRHRGLVGALCRYRGQRHPE